MTEPAPPVVGFKRHLGTAVVPGDAVYVLSEEGATALRGPHVESLVPLLDGTRDFAALRRELPPDVPADEAAGVLTRLAEAGLIGLRSAVSDPESAYWDAVDGEPASGRVAVLGADPATVDVLRAAGLTVAEDAGLSLVLCHDYLAGHLSDVDAEHRRTGRPWLLAKPLGARVWLGPFFTPGDGPCWHCLAARLWGNRPAEAHVRAALGLPGPLPRPEVALAPLTAVALNLVALEARKWLAGQRYPGQRALWTFDSRDLTGERHEVRARPQCASCGNPELVRDRTRRPVVLESRPKTQFGGGGHRALPPEQVLGEHRHLVSPLTGVVKELRRDTRGPALFASFRSGPNTALGRRGAERLRTALRSENGGKGVTPLQAEVGALCEALERHSGHYDGDEERVRASFRSLGDKAVHPDTCQLFHERQFADRARINARHGPFQFVGEPFDDDEVLDWTPVWSLTRGEHRLFPTALLYFDAPGPPSVLADSNGNAAGGTLEDAVLQGMLEVVERDAVALWWYNRTRHPAVDLAASGDPWIAELREVYAGLGREVWVLDVTSDLGIPVLAAVSRQVGGPREAIMLGFGAHLDPAVALRRALTELNQLVPAVLDGWDGGDDPDAVRWLRDATVATEPYLLPDPACHPLAPDLSSPDLLADVHLVRARLEAAGLEVFVLDQTRPDIGLPVVKVIVPGLRGFWARFAPGRLYDVPVRLGRLTEPHGYDDLNPMRIFL
ncbi:TOMM precursor leader peptide-binding protein [Amycolatopsis sp. FBCC-B4732]|uniref:TOMM precursor leader peptide-binding protein n=1 Tax=Amycolatopsis sp. FBCC-B4732 TaxID=3079339 RepID=UPI001FF194C0|nr:TOMM precursor leader peptide-binding protein [Amycolatopsis sp. FBCC-B4732]UOX90200.1 TOMM precursor leader peptide-binding protein [Amycolatopsis sp. FBCC-B4732]